MTTIYLTDEEILLIGSEAYDEGSSVEVREQAQFAANVARPASSAFGEDAFPNIWTKAASLLHGFATTQCLFDGNKRTAWASAWVMLRMNGVVGKLVGGLEDVDGAYDFVLKVSANEYSVEQVAGLLHQFDPTNKLPDGFRFVEPPVSVGGMLLGTGEVAGEEGHRCYVYICTSTESGVPVECLLTPDQARVMARLFQKAVDGGEVESLQVKIEQLVFHHDVETPPI